MLYGSNRDRRNPAASSSQTAWNSSEFNLTVGSCRADMMAGVDISKVQSGYFSDQENIEAFIEIGIARVAADLPNRIRFADFGGGTGVLTTQVSIHLATHGHKIHSIVVDANDQFLEQARGSCSEAVLADLETCQIKHCDLITMRAVNHYNPLVKQQKILNNVYRSMSPGAFLVSQISSGSTENCCLRSEVSNLMSLGRSTCSDGFHWTTVDDYLDLLRAAGFANSACVGEAPGSVWRAEDLWNRFNLNATRQAELVEDGDAQAALSRRRETFFRESQQLFQTYDENYSQDITGLNTDDNGEYIIHFKYPVIISRK